MKLFETKNETRVPLWIIILTIVLGLCVMSRATDYYVNGTTGDDAYDGLSATVDGGGVGPWETIGQANSSVSAGDTVYVAAGTYTESISPGVTGTLGNVISYIGASEGGVIIDVAGDGIDLNAKSYITVDKFTVDEPGSNGIQVNGTCSNLTFSNITVEKSVNWAVRIVYSTGVVTDMLIDDCTLNECGQTTGGGIYCYDSTRTTIQDTLVLWPQMGDGITGYNNVDMVVDGCEINMLGGGNHADGFQVGNCDGLVIKNCIVHSYSQNIYFGVNSSTDTLEQEIYIYGNITYNHYWWTVDDSQSQGIFFAENTGASSNNDINGMYIFNNTIVWNGNNGVLITSGNAYGNNVTDLVVINNIFVDAPNALDSIDDSGEVYSDYNWYWTSGTSPDDPAAAATPPALEGGNSTTGTSPSFTDYNATTPVWGVNLSAGSSAIGAGCGLSVLQSNIPGITSWTDRNGNTHDGSEPGAYAAGPLYFFGWAE